MSAKTPNEATRRADAAGSAGGLLAPGAQNMEQWQAGGEETHLMVVLQDPRPERGELPDYPSLPPLIGAAAASTRASARTWSYVFETMSGRRGRRFADRSLTSVSRNPMSSLHAFVDEMILVYFEALSDVPSTDDFVRLETEVEQLLEAQESSGIADDPMVLHGEPQAPHEVRIRPRSFSGLDGDWLTFPSEWQPTEGDPGIVRWMGDRHNGIVRVALLRHDDKPRPWLVLVHGAEMGRPFDARLLRAERLHKTLGVNVAMPILPRHGPRRGEGERIRGDFPGADFVDNYHGMAQAIWDVRRTLRWVQQQDPTAVGVFGFSLGGYISATLAALEPDIDALILGCPAVDLVDLFVRNMPKLRNGQGRFDHLYGRVAAAYQPIAPLVLGSVLDKERLGLIAATADRLADPIDHVSRLWHLWDRPEIHWIDSGHVSYFLRNDGTDALERMLIGRGVGNLDLT